MINSSRDRDFEAKQEETAKDNQLPQPTVRTTTTTTSRQWAGFKNPRIVRVSRTFGGKDRHSKVCTVRGLRDRRIRLSVPTAIQLYDLQDRLGLSQPSKVVDWLLEATKDEIDKLPPLQLPPGSFGQYFHQPNEPPHLSSFFSSDGGTQIVNDQQQSQRDDHGKSKYIDMDVDHSGNYSNLSRGKGTESEIREGIVDMNKWMTPSSSNHQHMAQLSAQNFFPVVNQSSYPSLPFNSYNHWEPSNLSLSQFGTQSGFHHSQQTDQQSNINPGAHHFVSPLALPSASQLFLTQSVFPQYSVDQTSSDPRQFNHFQHVFQNSYMPNLQLINQLNVYPKVHSQPDGNSQHDKSEGGS